MKSIMKSIVVKHAYLPEGALAFVVRGDMVFLYELDGEFQLWFTGKVYISKDGIKTFLDECRDECKHSDAGACCIGTFKEMMEELNNAN